MLKRLNIFGILIFIVVFFYLYKKNRKFRKSVLSSFIFVYFLVSETTIASASDADAFSPKNFGNRPSGLHRTNNQGQSGQSSAASGDDNGGSSSGQPGDLPRFPKPEPIEVTEKRRADAERRLHDMENSDEESESETESSNTLTETESSNTLTETEKSDNNQETVNSSTKMRPDGLPDDFEHLSETEQKSAENTKARRAEPLSVSEHDPNKSYGGKQLKIKGLKHLKDYKYDTKNMSEDEIVEKTKQISEDIISDPKSKIYKNATAHGIEDAVVIIRPDPLSMVAFDDHPRNEGKQHFISTYTISKDAHEAFLDTLDGMELPPELIDRISEWPNLSVSQTIGENGETIYKTRGPNMGEGVLERERREQEQKATLSPTAPSTYDSILPRFRMTNKQIRDAEDLRKEVQEKSLVLNEQETKLLKRFRAREKELARLENQLDLDNQGEL